MKKTLVSYLTIFVMVGTLLFGGLAYYSHIYTTNMYKVASSEARQDALEAAIEVIKYQARYEYNIGNVSSAASEYSKAIIGLYSRLVDTYVTAYTADLS